MDLKVSTHNGRVPVTVLQVEGDIDAGTSDLFKTKADELIASGARHILVDLSHTPFVSSAGLRAFHAIFNTLRSLHPEENLSDEEIKKGISAGTYKSPHLKLLNLSRETKAVFELSGFDMYIETFSDLKTVVASF